MISIIAKLSRENLLGEDINNMEFLQCCNYLNKNPALPVCHFQHRVETFFKVIDVDVSLGKIKCHAIRVEFQVQRSSHILSLLWILNAPVLCNTNINVYINFVDSFVAAYAPDLNENPKLLKHLSTYQVHSHSKSC